MKIPSLSTGARIYVDTSIYGGAFDDEYREASEEFFLMARAGRWRVVTSAVVQEEVSLAPPNVTALFGEIMRGAQVVDVTAEVLALRTAYVDAGIVRRESMADALHVAIASVAECDAIVSWNFRDIVNERRIHLYNEVNTSRGFRRIAIHSPLELGNVEDESI